MNKYKLYVVLLIKGVLMVDFIKEDFADNIIAAEDQFEKQGYIVKGQEYLITVLKP